MSLKGYLLKDLISAGSAGSPMGYMHGIPVVVFAKRRLVCNAIRSAIEYLALLLGDTAGRASTFQRGCLRLEIYDF